MSLTTTTPDAVLFPETHYVFIEQTGPFQNTAPQCWQSLHALIPTISTHNTVEKYFSLYNVEKKVYRAGVSLAAAPKNLPEGVRYEKVSGGKYNRFILTGPFSQLADATCRAFEIVAEKKIAVRDGFNIEYYVNDPRVTPEADLITEIMFPAA
ncbi:MAG TPA: GyrI-like domain-containing protein [Acidobacteriaceae bacterium]|nr:GyrI-like domain-containing protein [Acidobacteriaceae bacterium]